MTSRRADACALLVLALLVTALFADVLAGVNGLYMRDLTRYFYPLKQSLRQIVQHGEFPYWNPSFSAGQPLAANPQHEVFYPPTWLILLPSFDLGFRSLLLLHVYIGLFAMYALLRSMDLRPFAATIGALGWGLGGFYLSYLNLLPILFCAAWLPATCLFARRFLLRPNGRDFAAAGLFLGLQLLVGEPTTVLQTGLLLGAYALYRGWYAAPRFPRMMERVAWVGLIFAAALLVAAAQVLPAIDHVRDSARSRPFDFAMVSTWSLPWARLAELAFPNLLGHISIDRVMWYWGGGLYPDKGVGYLFSIYSGLLLFALAVGGALSRPRGGRLVLSLCAVSVLLALGDQTPLLPFLYDHGLSSIRYPEKFLLLGVFAGVVFAAQVLQCIVDGDEVARRGALGVAVAAAGLAATLAVASFFPVYSRVFLHVWGLTAIAGARRMIALSRLDWLVAMLRGLLLVALLATLRTRWRAAWRAAVVIYLAADLGYVTREINPRMPRRFFDPPPVVKTLLPDHAAYRIFHQTDGDDGPEKEMARLYFQTGGSVYWVLRNGLFPMTPAGSGLRTVMEPDYDQMLLLPTVDLLDSIEEVKSCVGDDWYEPFLAFSNAWYRGVYRPFEAERARTRGNFQDSLPVVFLEGAHYPRYYFADQVVTIRDREDFADKLCEESFSSAVAFIARPAFTPARGVVRQVTETANRATLDVESFGQGGLLVMSVTPHKYWRVTIDGLRVDPIVTNLAYQSVLVPSGRHRVEMRYRNELVIVGLWISAVTASLLLVLVAGGGRLAARVGKPSAGSGRSSAGAGGEGGADGLTLIVEP